MKKLMIALAAAATTMFSFGDDVLPHGADFEAEGYVAGENFTSYVNKAEDGVTTSGNRYWYSTSEDIGVISNHQEIGVTSVPDLYENATPTGGVKYLQLDTQTPLFRTIKSNDQSGSFTGVDVSTGDGVYLDTLVKFTAADEAFADLTEGDKIAIEYVEHEAEGDDVGYTNFVIRAGYLSSPLSQTNYFAAVPANFNKDAWHRLTVRSFGSIDAAGNVGFVVYLDGVPLEYDTDVDAGPSFTPTGAAAAFYTDSLHALFPSAVPALQTGAQTISAVAFSGNGSIDDVVFTTTMPEFIRTSSLVRTEITLGTGVTGVTVTVGENTIEPEDATATTLVFNLPAGTTSFVLGVAADSPNGYTFDETTGITPTDVTYDAETDTVTITGTNPALTLVGKRNNVTYIDDNDQQQSCPSLATAFANAKSGTTITLAYDVDAADTEDAGFEGYTISSKSVVLDLNGQTITWTDSEGTGQSLFNIATGASLTVIDSSASNTGKIVYGGEYGAFYNDGECYVGAASGDYGPTIEGILYNVGDDCGPQIVRGKFDKLSNSTEGETQTFIGAAAYIESGSELKESLGDYWVVAPQGGSEPTEIAVPTAESNLVYNGTEQTGVAAGTGYTLTGVTVATDAGEYTATATPGSGYAWVGGSTDATNITWSIAKATVTATVSLTVTEATYDSTKTTVTDYTTPSLTFGLGAPELVENTDYTVAWSATEVTGAGTFTYTVSPVADSNYTFTETSATLTITEGGKTYPSYIDDAEEKTKYDTWAAYAEISAADFPDATGSNQEAYLLNCKPSEVADAKAAFKFTAFDQANPKDTTKTTTTTSYNGRDYNGTVVIKQYSDVGCTTESATGTFFRAVLQ